jgi:anti-sigma B factor antagonist
MEHEIKDQNGAIVISFEGDMDLQSSPQAREALLDCVGRNRPVLVDLSRVNYIDSSGVASLVESLQTARKRGSKLVLVSVSETAMRVFKLARLETVFSIFETLDEALAKTGEPS